MDCPVCGQRLGFLTRLFTGPIHDECRLAQQKRAEELRRETKRLMYEQIREGKFKDLSSQAGMMLDQGESCFIIIKGCWHALFYPRAAGRVAPGQGIRVDGLKKRDWGTLNVTDKRVCFIGQGGSTTIQLRKILHCEIHGDALHVISEGRASAAHFIVESQDAIEILEAAISKLAAMAKSGLKPHIVAD